MSLQFATPLALLLLVLAPLPILLARRRPPLERRAVANLYLWREVNRTVEGQLAPRRRRVSVSTLLQVLGIAAAAVALARPAIILPASRVTMVFDISASMGALDGGGSRLAAARTAARRVLKELPAASRVRVIAAAATPRDLGEYSSTDPSLAARLDALSPTAGASDITAAIAIADAHGPAPTIVFSDEGSHAPGVNPGGALVRWIRVGHAASNVAISHVSARRTSVGKDAGDVLVEVRNFTAQPMDMQVELAVDGRPAGVRTLRVPAAGADTLTASLAPLGRVVSARLLASDALAVDDVRFAVVPASEPLKVTLLGRRGSYVEHALAANPLVSLETIDARSASHVSLDRADVVVCDGCSAPPAAARSVLLLPASATPAPARVVTVADPDHPLAADLELVGESASPVTGASPGTGHVVLRAGGVPVLTAYEGAHQRVAEWRLDLSRPDFALSPAFPVLVANAVQWLGRRDDEKVDVASGDPLRIPVRDEAALGGVVVKGPDGRTRQVTRVGRELVVPDTSTAGIYTVRTGDTERVAVVNPVVDTESSLAAAAAEPRRDQVEGIPVSAELLPLAPVCAALAAALIAVEWRYRALGAA